MTLIVVSFPKSGRTWLRVMLDHLGIEAKYSHEGADHLSQRHYSTLIFNDSALAEKKVLMLTRDPRDTVVSGYFQVTRRLKRLKLYPSAISQLIRDERHGIIKIVHFNLMWLAAIEKFPHAALVTYEGLHVDTQATLSAIIQFAGARRSEDDVRKAMESGRFDTMQKGEASLQYAKSYNKALLPGDPNDLESFKVRRGVVGGYIDYLTASDIEYCNQIIAENDYWSRFDVAFRSRGIGLRS